MPGRHERGKKSGQGHPGSRIPRLAPPVDIGESATGLVQTVAAQVDEGAPPDEVAAAISAAPAAAQAALIDAIAARLEGEPLDTILAALMHQPLDSGAAEHVIALLERARTPLALETLDILGTQASARTIRRAAKGALFRLRASGLVVPERMSMAAMEDAAAWPVVYAWATRVDNIGSQAVGLARTRPQGDVAYISLVISDDRGLVDGMGQSRVSLNHVRRLVERMSLPPGVSPYAASPAYVVWRIRQGEATSRQAGRSVAPEYLTWGYLLAGIDDEEHPDLEAVCHETARPHLLERTSVLMYALELSDWWPGPDGDEGRAVRHFIADVTRALDALPHGGRAEHSGRLELPEPPPYLEMLAETHYIAVLWAFDSAGAAAIDAAIDVHLDAVLPPERLRRCRDALLQMGYLSGENAKPTLSSLMMTAAWALDPAARIPPRRHPFLRQMLRKTVEVMLVT